MAPPILIVIQGERSRPQRLAHNLATEDAATARRDPQLLPRRAEQEPVKLDEI